MSPARSRALSLLGAALLVQSSACRTGVRTPPPAGDAPPAPVEAPSADEVALVGFLDVVASGAPGAERVWLVTPDDRIALILDGGQLASLGPAARMPGARASVRGTRVAASAPTVRVISISLLPRLP